MDGSRAEGSRQNHGDASSSLPAHVLGHSENEQLNRPNPNSSQAPTIQNSDTQSPIYLLAKDCLRRFNGLYAALHNSHPDGSQRLTFDLGSMRSIIEDAHTRFRAWGTNIAAFRKGTFRTSLDFRLAEAPRIKYRTIQVLEDLKQYLNEVDLIARGEKINETWGLDDTSDSSDYSDEDDKDQKGKGVSLKGQTSGSDVGELLKAITASNSSLMKLSIVIRSSATRDDYLKAASRFSTWNPSPDIGHVQEKYGSAKYSTNWLLERLGKAITRRRQFLRYRIEHNDRIVGAGADDEDLRDGPTKTIASTKATTFIGENILQNVREAGSDAGNSFGSATSYEQTIFQGDGSPTMLTVPPPPKSAFPTRFGFPKIPFEYGQPFQCPYCFTEQTVENKSAWKTHVFRDLKPYVCTFAGCEMLMFRSRNEWFTHELQNHRREWACQFCQHSPFTTVSDFSKHTETAHAAILSTSPLKALIMLSEEPIDKISSTACPLCDNWETDMVRKQAILESVFPSSNGLEKKDGLHSKPKLFRRHLGRHMEQLALFALPPNHFDDLEDGSTYGEREDAEDDSLNEEEDDLSEHERVDIAQDVEDDSLNDEEDGLSEHERVDIAKEDYELERTREELRKFKLEQQHIEDKKILEKEIELKQLQKQQEEEEEMKAEIKTAKATTDPEVEKKLAELERQLTESRRLFNDKMIAREEKEALEEENKKKQRDKEYKERLEEDLRKSSLTKQKEIRGEIEAEMKADEATTDPEVEKKLAELERQLKESRKLFDDKKIAQEAEKALEEENEKKQRDKEYKVRLEKDLRDAGLTEEQIYAVLNKEKVKDKTPTGLTYTRMSRRYLSLETLNNFRVDYMIDQDPDYILVKRWVPEHEQDFLWAHTKELREERQNITNTTSTSTTAPQIEGKDGSHHSNNDAALQYNITPKMKNGEGDKPPIFRRGRR